MQISPSVFSAARFTGQDVPCPASEPSCKAKPLAFFKEQALYDPLLKRHGVELLQDAAQKYIQAQDAPTQAKARFWVRKLLSQLCPVKSDHTKTQLQLTPTDNFALVHPVLRANKPALAALLKQHGADVPAPETLQAADQALRQEMNRFVLDTGKVLNLLSVPGIDTQKALSDGFHSSLLHKAVSNNDNEIAKALIRAGADLKARDQFKRTPLAWATWLRRTELVKTLIGAGANPNPADIEGFTPLFWAKYMGSQSMEKLLQAHGAKGIVSEDDGGRGD
jgi:hypothetical protein